MGRSRRGRVSVVRAIRFPAKNANISDCLSKFERRIIFDLEETTKNC